MFYPFWIVFCLTTGVGQCLGDCRPFGTQSLTFGTFFPSQTTLPGNKGVLTTPGYPLDYNPFEQCAWVIWGPTGSYISVDYTSYHVGALSTLYFVDGIGPFGGKFYLQQPISPATLPASFQSSTNIVGINWATANETSTGWSFNFTVHEAPDTNLLEMDSTTTTLVMAIISTLIAFGSLFFV